MSTKNLFIAALASTTVFVAANTNADLLAFYADGTDADAGALLNIAPANTDITVSDLSDVGAQTGDPSRITRPSFATDTPVGPTAGSSVGSEWLEARSLENNGTPGTADNYFVFTVDAEPGLALDLTSLKYDFWVSSGSGFATEATVEAFVSVDGGSFVSVGSVSSADTGASDFTAAVGTANFDLTSFSGAESVEVRLGVGYSSGISASVSGFVQGIQLEGDVVPEPGSLALLGLGGLLIARRRRA